MGHPQDRSARRHLAETLKRWVVKNFARYRPLEARGGDGSRYPGRAADPGCVGRDARTPHPCSTPGCCGNPRPWYGPSVQELRQRTKGTE